MPVVTKNKGYEIELMKWGMIPFWAKDPRIGFKMINARDDSVTVKPSFRKPFHEQRCLIPASGFYEWKKTVERKTPYYIHSKTPGIITFAGLYDIWEDAEGREIKSYTILTTKANSVVEAIHDRMPVILRNGDEDMWLEKETEEASLREMLKPSDPNDLESYPVSDLVNNPRNNSDVLLQPLKNKV